MLSSINNTPTLVPQTTAAVVEQASDAFWATVAAACPHITTGDLDPQAEHELQEAMTKAIEAWLVANQPAVEA